MGILVALLAIAALIGIAWIGGSIEGLHFFFGVLIPYLAIGVFALGIVVRIMKWAKRPVPFRIPSTCGQQKSLDFIKQNRIDNPFTKFQVFLRMVFEVLFFRSLFRNTKAEVRRGVKIVYGDDKWLWGLSLIFHYSFLIIFLRHFRFFTDPVPGYVEFLNVMDGFFQMGLPVIYMTSAGLIAAGLYLLGRRIFNSRVRYISLVSDYFPLFLIMGIAISGVWMRHVDKVNLQSIKQLSMGIISFNPVVPDGLETSFFIHFFLVCVLLMYFPISKLVHAPGVFMSPTRNMANNNRAKHHKNPWNDDFKMHHHTYEEYEDEFRQFMKSVDLPLEKEEVDDK